MTQQEFNEMLLVGLGQVGLGDAGSAVENEQEVPTVLAADVVGENAVYYSLPMVKSTSGVLSYCKVDIAAVMNQIANSVATTGLLQAVTQEEFDAIFYPGSSSSSSSD